MQEFHSKIDLDGVLIDFNCDFELSVSANEVIQLVNAAEPDVDALASAIIADQSLTLRVIKLANSPYYGFSRKINTVKDAIVVLGQKSLLNMVLAFAIKGLHRNMGPVEKGLWEESAALALAAQFLTQHLGEVHLGPDEAFMAGLLCNIGELVINSGDAELYKKVLHESRETGQREMFCRQLCSVGFSEIGASILQQWNLSSLLVLSAYYVGEDDLCGDESDALYRACSIVSLARMMVSALNIGNYVTSNPVVCSGCIAKLFDLNQEKFAALCDEFSEDFAIKGTLLVSS